MVTAAARAGQAEQTLIVASPTRARRGRWRLAGLTSW
jgi:hypothetical protein